MKVIVKRKIEVETEISKILVKAGVRYWCDCSYSEDNGKTWVEAEEDDEATDQEMKTHIPFVIQESIFGRRPNDYWNLVIDAETGKIENWPKDFCIRAYFKVCDDGLYQILDNKGEVVWDSTVDGDYYVPDFLSICDEGYGDYLCFNVNGDGIIEDWNVAIKSIKELFEHVD